MSNKKRLVLLLLLIVIVLFYLWYQGREDTSYDHAVARANVTSPMAPAAGSDQLLVDLHNDADADAVKALEKRYGLKLRPNSRFSWAERLFRSKLRPQRDVRALIAELRAEEVVERVELDAVYSLPPLERAALPLATSTVDPHHASPQHKGFPNDPKFLYQWHMDQIGMRSAWKRGQGEGVIVAVIDTGVAYKDRGSKFKQVPDLAQTEFVPGYDFVNDHEFGLDDHGHGTHVAGTIAQSTHNGVGVAGVAFRAKIMPLKVLSARGFGNVADIAEAVRFAADHGAKVINMSLGGPRASSILASAIKYAYGKGVIVVCAAGNDGKGKVGYPAAYPEAFAVSATQFDRTVTFYSNYGKEIAIAAPGGNTRVDQNEDGMPDGVLQNTIKIGKPAENDYLLFMGTSMAAPHAAGVAALVVAAGVTKPDAVAQVLTSTAVHPKGTKRDDRYGAGIVNADAALAKVRGSWGAQQLGLAAGLMFLLFGGLASRRQLGLRFGPGAAFGALLGSSGLFFLPVLGLASDGALGAMLTSGLPAWDQALFGAAGHGNPLFYGALIPLLLAVGLYGVSRLRGLMVGLLVGVAAHLLFFAFFSAVNVAFVPDLFDGVFLALNALICLVVAAGVALRVRA